VIANPLPEHPSGSQRVLKLHGLNVGTTMIEAGVWNAPAGGWAAGSPWVALQVEVKDQLDSPLLPDRLQTLSAPHMALNATHSPVTYSMKYTRTISPMTSLHELAAIVNNVGPLKHLAMSAHGQVTRDDGGVTDSVLGIGKTIGRADVSFFRDIRRSIAGGILWLGGCAMGADSTGCEERARAAQCYIVAPTLYMALRAGQGPGPLPYGKMDMWSAYKPAVLDPHGNKLGWPRFATHMGRRLGLRL
jgi:hypothetical protein